MRAFLVIAVLGAGFSLLLAAAAHRVSQSAARASASEPYNTPRQTNFAPSDSSPKAIQVVSWNIDRGKRWPTIENELSREHPDLCLLQEVDWGAKRTNGVDVAKEVARSLHLNMAYGTEFEELSQQIHSKPAYIGQATLTRLPISRVRVLRFRKQSDFWKPHSWLPSSLPLTQRRAGGRIALITEVTYRDRPLVIYNLHLESRSAGSLQMEQLNEVLFDLQGYPPGTPAIIGGDFNSKYFPSAFLKRMEQAGFRSVTGERIERSHTIMMALDWIFVRGEFDINGGKIDRDLKGSDHYPVVALVRSQLN